jgi:hypothetical protein
LGEWRETGMENCVSSGNFFYKELRLGSMCVYAMLFCVSVLVVVVVCYRAIYDLGFITSFTSWLLYNFVYRWFHLLNFVLVRCFLFNFVIPFL